jgi:peptidoglycan hydrolase-like protein with peptidoglycan-binding domain
MTPHIVRRVLGTFVLLAAAVMINVLAMQTPSPRSTSGRAGKPAVQRDVAAEKTGVPAAGSGGAMSGPVSAGDNPATITAIQRELVARDYDPGAPDGHASVATRAAIMAWEHDNDLPPSGEPTVAGLKAIILGVQPETAAQIASELKALPSARQPRTQHLVRSVQVALSDLGYVLGTATGQMNDDTVRAIREFEQEQALPSTGRISALLVTRLARLSKPASAPALR